jgi:Domain of unknown function (DUF4274)
MGFVVAPGRKTYQCWKPKEHKDAIIRWLDAHGPREWHVAADIWNWDGGHDILALIMEQPQCDRATCQMIFARSEADDYLTSPDRFHKARNDPGSVLNMILDMLTRWRNGFYMIGQFALPEGDLSAWANLVIRYQLAVIDHWNRDPELMLPQDFMSLGYGDRVDPNYYWDRRLIPGELQP